MGAKKPGLLNWIGSDWAGSEARARPLLCAQSGQSNSRPAAAAANTRFTAASLRLAALHFIRPLPGPFNLRRPAGRPANSIQSMAAPRADIDRRPRLKYLISARLPTWAWRRPRPSPAATAAAAAKGGSASGTLGEEAKKGRRTMREASGSWRARARSPELSGPRA